MKIDGNTPITLNLTLETLNVALAALSGQPYERVAGLIQSIQQQANAQISAYQAEEAANLGNVPVPPQPPAGPANDEAAASATE